MMTSWIHLPTPNVLCAIGFVFALMVSVSLWLFLAKDSLSSKMRTELTLRVKTFWVIILLVVASLMVSPTLAVTFWGVISYLLLKEYFTIIPTRNIDRRVLFWAYLAIPIQYYWIATGWYGMFVIFIPVYVFLFLPFRMVMLGETKGFLQAIGTIQWGMMMVYSISCIAALYLLDPQVNVAGGIPGWVLLLLFLNQFNDAAQFFWGKNFGRHKIIPTVSPNKTVEGFVGGVMTTTLFSVLLASLLTPLSWVHSILLGMIIAVAGFMGDIVISALKRDLEIKDTGNLLPGHGGILDRIDSLIFTAPLYFHFIHYFYY